MISSATTYDAATARDQLPDLLRRAASGEEIILSESGTPLARLVALLSAEEAPAKPTYEEVMAHLETMRGSVLYDDTEPGEPACDPSEWDANRDSG